MFSEYDFLLKQFRGEGDNYWSDVLILNAIFCLNKFSENEWRLLKSAVKDTARSNDWLCACAETLSEVEDFHQAFFILLSLIYSDSLSVRLAALDSINSLLSQINGNDIKESDLYKLKEILTLYEDTKGITAIMIKSLKVKLDKLLLATQQPS